MKDILLPRLTFDPDHICFMCGGTFWCFEIVGFRGKAMIKRDKPCDCKDAKAYRAQIEERTA